MITDRDRDIINFIYNVGFASISNIHYTFFMHCKYGYDIARKRLKKIYDNGNYLRKFMNVETNEIVYIPTDSKLRSISIHNMKCLDYICKLKQLGCEIIDMELEPVFVNIKPDAYISFKFDGYMYFQLLEVELRHNFVDMERFKGEEVVESILERTNGVAPTIVIVQDTNVDYTKKNTSEFDIVQMKSKMTDIAKTLKI